MKKTVDQSRSIWVDTSRFPLGPKLTGKISTDICIVGAGIAGMSTAYSLAREGKSVVVLDDGPIGGGMTARITALLDRLTHHCHIVETGNDSWRFSHSSLTATTRKTKPKGGKTRETTEISTAG